MGTSFTEEVTPELEILLVERIDVCARVCWRTVQAEGLVCAKGQRYSVL